MKNTQTKQKNKRVSPPKPPQQSKKVKKSEAFAGRSNKKNLSDIEKKEIEKAGEKFIIGEKKRFDFVMDLLGMEDEQERLEWMQDFSKNNSSDRMFVAVMDAVPKEYQRKVLDRIAPKKQKKIDLFEMEWSTQVFLDALEEKKLQSNLVLSYEKYWNKRLTFPEIKQKILEEHTTLMNSFLTKQQQEENIRNLKRLVREKEKTQGPPRTIKLVDLKGNIIEDVRAPDMGRRTLGYQVMELGMCEKYYKKSWIPGYSNDGEFYVFGMVNERVLEDTNLVDVKSTIIHDSKKYYKAKNNLDYFLCTSIYKKQTKNILTGQFKDGRLFEFLIVYVYGGIQLVQDESLYVKEVEWITQQYSAIYQTSNRVKEFLEKELITSTSKFYLYILNIMNTFFDEKSSKYLLETFIENTKGNASLFMNSVARIMIFLDTDYLGSKLPFFHQKLQKNVFILEDLPTLTPKEILQEIYEDPRNYSEDDLFNEEKTNIEKLTEDIEDQVSLYIFNTVNIFSYDPTERIATGVARRILKKTKIQERQIITECQNKIEDIKWDTIYYRDPLENKLFCFNLLEIVEQIYKGDFINPHTGTQFSIEFIDGIKKYSLENTRKAYQKAIKTSIDLTNILFEDLNTKELSLEPSQTCSFEKVKKYWETYVLSSNPLEEKLRKSPSDIDSIKKIIEKPPQIKHEEPKINKISLPPQKIERKKEEKPPVAKVVETVAQPDKKKIVFSKKEFGQKKN